MASVDTPELPEEIVTQICRGLAIQDIVHLSEVCKYLAYFLVLTKRDSNSQVLWKFLIKRDFSSITNSGCYQSCAHYRNLYIQLARAKISLLGMASPNGAIKLHKIKDEFKRTRQQRVAETSGIRSFYVLLYHHTNATRKVAAYAVDDAASYYGKVLHFNEVNKLLAEGTAKVWIPGPYKVVWRIKLAPDYGLGAIEFTTKVLNKPDEEAFYDGDEEEEDRENDDSFQQFIWLVNEYKQKPANISVEKWLDVDVGNIIVEKPHTTVCFKVSQGYHDWKYGMFVDYVELVPITMEEYKAAKGDNDVVMKDN
eukprot:TRINITY_DN9434_c0_g1_i1.p1 TRINITY_DN9434_c0_g1~~TRINITY_DN9434_c0_g1_i1.p1  ORF type:complete len:310 (-),score=12.85 TRINITY_DN9434_c0_g1_i1:144-1073(-)